MNKKNVKYFNAYGTLVDKNTIKLVDKKGEEKKITAKNILIAVGGRPNYLNLPNAKELCYTSDDIFWSKKEFGKTLVVGGGYIAMECAGFLNNFGKKVTILYRSKILKKFDQDIVEKLVDFMKEQKITF